MLLVVGCHLDLPWPLGPVLTNFLFVFCWDFLLPDGGFFLEIVLFGHAALRLLFFLYLVSLYFAHGQLFSSSLISLLHELLLVVHAFLHSDLALWHSCVGTGVDHDPVPKAGLSHAVVGQVGQLNGGRQKDNEGVNAISQSEVILRCKFP